MNYGWKGIGLPDQRDEQFSYKGIFKSIEIPPVKYLICPPVADQGDLGACVFFALSYALEAMQLETYEEIPINPSQLFAYYRYRELYGNIFLDDGAFIRDAIKTYATGVCLEEDWPYVLANFSDFPGKDNYVKAEAHKIKSYHAIYTQEDMIQCLASGFGFVGGISCYESFDSSMTENTGIVNIPGMNEKLLGGHALYFGGGYDLHKGMIKFQNSYGPDWGEKGFGWISIQYLTNPRLAGDFWTVRS